MAAASAESKVASPGSSKDVIVINKKLENLFTAVFAALLFIVTRVFCKTLDGWVELLLSIAGASVAIFTTKMSSRFLGATFFSQALQRPRSMKKFEDQMWQLVIHVGMTSWELYVLHDEPWYSDTDTLWIPHHRSQHVKTSLRLLYVMQTAIWIVTCVSHRFLEKKHKDYFVMYFHHLCTIGLMCGSYFNGCLRIGMLVLFIHDVSDIFMDLLKLSNYLKLDMDHGFPLVETLFVGNLASWVYWRLYVFPFKILDSAFFGSRRLSGCTDWWDMDCIYYHHPQLALLVFLLCLHVFWFYLLVRIAFKLVFATKAHQAAREEYEGTSDEDDATAAAHED